MEVASTTSVVALNFEAFKLRGMDLMSKSDPQIIVYMNGTEVGRTEKMKNNHNPKFMTEVQVTYNFEEVQKVRFDVVDIDGSDSDFLGAAETVMGTIVGSSGATWVTTLKNRELKESSKSRGSLHVHATEVEDSKTNLLLECRANDCDKKDLFGKSDPFFIISVGTGFEQWRSIYRSETIRKTLDPHWKTTEIPLHRLKSGEGDNTKVRFEVFDWDSDGSHDLIGNFETSVSELTTMSDGCTKDLINAKKLHKKGKKYTNSGRFTFVHCRKNRINSFLDYVVGGLEISFIAGVDYTGSNGAPSLPSSLHYLNPYAPNAYQESLLSVGQVIAPYDSDQLFPLFGFGAVVPQLSRDTLHCFPVNMNNADANVWGVKGMLDYYRDSLKKVKLSGPTHFAPIIRHATKICEHGLKRGGQKYYNLLILTDGAICDMAATKDAIVYASSLPMSIIIVGVGNANFDSMEELDGDDGVLRGSKGPVHRDIVQFVPFNKFKAPVTRLAKEVLAEVPNQVVDYFKKRNIQPQPPRQAAAVGPDGVPAAVKQPPSVENYFAHSAPTPVNRSNNAYGVGPPPSQQGGYAGYCSAPPQQYGVPPQQYAGYPPQQYAGYPPQQQSAYYR